MKVKAVTLQAAGLLARKGLLALSFLIVARTLGPKVYGELAYLFTWTYIFFTLSSLGFSAVSTREIAREIQDNGNLLRASLIVRFVSACVGSGVLSALILTPALFGQTDSLKAALIYAWIIPAYAILDQLGAYAMGFGDNASFATMNLVQWGSFLVATILSVFFRPELGTLVVWQTAGLWIGLFLACIYLRPHLRNAWQSKTDYVVAWFLFKEALPLAVTNIVAILYFRLGTLYLFRYSGPEQTGIFSSASQIVEASQLIPMAIVGAFYPIICRVAQDLERLNLIFEEIAGALVFIALFLATTGTVVSSTIVRLIYGSSFSSASLLLRILIWTVVPTFLHYALAYFLIALRRQRVIPISALVGLVVSLFCNFVFVRRFGAMGAVYSSAATEVSICVFHLIFVLRYIVLGRQLRFASIAAAGALVVWSLGTNWEREINATMAHALSFCALSVVLFLMGFLLYRRMAAGVETA
jgi:PST family polysaccharide transporter